MKITCPNCGFGRIVNEAALPPKAVMATCPKCQFRFKFREVEAPSAQQHEEIPTAGPIPAQPVTPAEPEHAQPEPEHQAPAQTQQPEPHDEDLWKELEALNDSGEAYDTHEQQPEPSLPAWERATSGYPQAFFRTFLDVLTGPKHFFSAMPVGNGMMKPLVFFLLIIQAVALSQSIWQLLGIVPPSMLTENLGTNLQAAIALILYPLEVSLFLFMDTAINHFFLRLFKADTKGFEGTFRAEAYSAAPMLLIIIPYIGLPMAMIGTTVYKFLGLRHVHGASNKQVLAVLILPMLLAFVVAIILTLATGKV